MQNHPLNNKFCLIGACFGLGAQIPETGLAPRYLKKLGLAEKLGFAWDSMLAPSPGVLSQNNDCLEIVSEFNMNLCKIIQKSVSQKYTPVVIGGDHSIAIGTWSGITTAYNVAGNFGLIWFDAHLDAHTHKTSPSNAIHGMPIASLLGYGKDQLRNIGAPYAKISPHHLVVVGARSYEDSEHAFLKELGVKIFYMDSIKKQGIEEVIKQALQIVNSCSGGFGLSIDLDVFDPQDLPGVGSPARDGIPTKDGLKALKGLGCSPSLKAIEIAELNPNLDRDNVSTYFAMDLLKILLIQ